MVWEKTNSNKIHPLKNRVNKKTNLACGYEQLTLNDFSFSEYKL